MLEHSFFIVSWLILFLFVGAIWYVLDRRLGQGIYRWWYGMTHAEPLDAEIERGFIFGQPAKVRFSVAISLSLIQSVIVLLTTEDAKWLVELFTFVFEVPVMMFGFYLGPRLNGIWERKEKIFETMDKMESGDYSITGSVKQKIEDVYDDAVEAVVGRDEEPVEVSEKSVISDEESELEEVVEERAVEKSDEETSDPRGYMDRYLKKGE